MVEMYVPNTKIRYRDIGNGAVTTWDNGETWHFTFRSPSEWLEMFPAAISDSSLPIADEREIFGETLDEPIPDDMWEMICRK